MQEINKRNARIWSMLGMRRVVGMLLGELAESDPAMMFATADVARYFGTEEFQKNYPNIDYEMLLGDYTDIEEWIMEGRIDCGFTRLPVRDEMDTIFLEQDRLLVVLPEGHPLTELQKIPVSALCEEPFMLLEKGAKAEVSEIFERSNLKPKVHFTTWDDYAIMAMVESGLGISVLPELILKRIPYRIVTRELEIPAYRNIGLAMRNRKGATPAVKRFLEYLQYR